MFGCERSRGDEEEGDEGGSVAETKAGVAENDVPLVVSDLDDTEGEVPTRIRCCVESKGDGCEPGERPASA